MENRDIQLSQKGHGQKKVNGTSAIMFSHYLECEVPHEAPIPVIQSFLLHIYSGKWQMKLSTLSLSSLTWPEAIFIKRLFLEGKFHEKLSLCFIHRCIF